MEMQLLMHHCYEVCFVTKQQQQQNQKSFLFHPFCILVVNAHFHLIKSWEKFEIRFSPGEI